MNLHLDEPYGFRHENNERQAKLALVLTAIMAVVSVALILYVVKFVSYAG